MNLNLFVASTMSNPKLRGVHMMSTKRPTWRVPLITINMERRYLGTWRDLEKASHAYDYMAF
jgi:hypothetical protein